MPRRKKDKKQAELDRFKKLAELAGMDVEQVMEQIPSTEIGESAIERHSIEAESVLFYINSKGKGFIEKTCEYCKSPFVATYRAVAYCQDFCRARALEKQGIIWNYHNRLDADRWNIKNKGYVPKVISAEATEVLKESGNYYGNEDQ